MSALYLTHGGGPLPLLGHDGHQELITFLRKIPDQFEKPSAILMISAHWELPQPTLTSSDQPPLIYDYSGFPPESYEIKYPAPGSKQLAGQVQGLLNERGFHAELDDERGFDHGMFVPLKLMYPDADIPCVQLSLIKGLDPEQHITMGAALTSLHEQGVLIIGSGSSFHNLRAIMASGQSIQSGKQKSIIFNDWLMETCTSTALADDERYLRLINWQQAPHALYCHPREEHLMPLHVCMGSVSGKAAETVFNGKVFGLAMCGFLWS